MSPVRGRRELMLCLRARQPCKIARLGHLTRDAFMHASCASMHAMLIVLRLSEIIHSVARVNWECARLVAMTTGSVTGVISVKHNSSDVAYGDQ